MENDIYSTLPQKDFGGAEIHILSYASSYGARDEFLYSEQTGDVVDDALFSRNLLTEQRLGVKLVYDDSVTDKEAPTKFQNSVLAGDDTYDVFAFKLCWLGSIFTSGVLRSWDDIDGINYDKPWYVKDANDTFTIGGKHFSIFSDALATNMTCAWAYAYNKRIAEDWGITDIYDVVLDGKWTVDKLSEITKDIYMDVNGDGKHDKNDNYGFYLDCGGPLDAFMISSGIYALKKDDDDYPELCLYSEKLVTAFEKYYSLLWDNTGTYMRDDQDFVNVFFYEYVENFANGQALFSPMFIQYFMEDKMRGMKDEYGILPYPKLDEAQAEYMTYVLPRHGGFMLPKTLTDEKEEMIGYVIDCMSAYSYKELRPAIYEVALKAKGVRDDESIEMIDLVLDSRRYDFVGALQMNGSFNFTQDKTFRSLLGAKNKDITSFYESNKTSAEIFIENLIEQFKENE